MVRRNAHKVALAVLGAICVVVVLVTCGRIATDPAITVGFVYDTDETTAYSYNFYKAQEALQAVYGDRIKVFMYSNVQENNVRAPMQKLAERGCKVIFTNSHGNVRQLAREFPNIEFCQVSCEPYPTEDVSPNYHSFNGEVYQVRYASGVVAGIKLQQMIEARTIRPNEALAGFVAAYPNAEVISGYTAFLLGIRSVVPQATMRVKYTNSWNSYTLEKACASELLDEGCVVISQHTDTIGPAIACEEYYARDVFHVGYNMDMTDVASYTSLTSARIDWTPYVRGAVDAIIAGKPIEDVVQGNVHANNDMSGGIKDGWVRLTRLNDALLPKGTQSRVDELMQELQNGHIDVFHGDYTGKNPADPTDVVDLHTGFKENKDSSIPSFCYVLDDVITVDE